MPDLFFSFFRTDVGRILDVIRLSNKVLYIYERTTIYLDELNVKHQLLNYVNGDLLTNSPIYRPYWNHWIGSEYVFRVNCNFTLTSHFLPTGWIFTHFDSFWRKRGPIDVMEFNPVRAKFEVWLKPRLSREKCHLTMTSSAWKENSFERSASRQLVPKSLSRTRSFFLSCIQEALIDFLAITVL